jgi:hypothetical protein
MGDPVTGELMKCTWYLIKRYGIQHKWAYKTAKVIRELPGKWDWVVRKPDSPPLSWAAKNKVRFMEYLSCYLKYADNPKEKSQIEEAIQRLKKSIETGDTFSLSNLANIEAGKFVFICFDYYAASRNFEDTEIITNIVKETNDTSSNIHIPCWGDD